MNKRLKELQEKFLFKQNSLKDLVDYVRAHDISKGENVPTALSGCKTSKEAVEKIQAYSKELNDLHDEVKSLQDLDKQGEELDRDVKARDRVVDGLPAMDSKAVQGRPNTKSLGHQLQDMWADQLQKGLKGSYHQIALPDFDVKALFQRTDGFEPEGRRDSYIEPLPRRPLQLLDLVPQQPTGLADYRFMKQTVFTNNAAERLEAGLYVESALKWEQFSVPIESIGTSLPVTDEQLEDVAGIQALIDNDLMFMVEQRFDSQLVNGNGVPPNIRGYLNHASIQDYTLDSESITDAVYKALTLVRIVGRAIPDGIAMHALNFQTVRLMRTADGLYIWGHPSEAGPARMWGLPVVENEGLPLHTALVGAFRTKSKVMLRRGVVIEVGYVDDQFVKGTKTIRAGMRAALVVTLDEAFSTVTSLDQHVDTPSVA